MTKKFRPQLIREFSGAELFGEMSFRRICSIPDQIANNLLEMFEVVPSINNTFGVEVSELVRVPGEQTWLVKPKNHLPPNEKDPQGLALQHHWLLLSCDYLAEI